ncbi:putative spermidine/putrescine transport system substrate-binding protein [Thiothrix eikelboomii]|uniref:Putative spermidine/putrescine transport system substrate-binding protein n=1 Tax=Thiothrix eikelboomii TaxID=92487 RepID=A0A1T4X8B0_9GAMM|nr:extracellular solute-binding protein [Thiothrix eikelboomii]SKA85806.1 putative spermidine/putrescine transport system substrate-binding protein [Thiothrix eikelboomii]
MSRSSLGASALATLIATVVCANTASAEDLAAIEAAAKTEGMLTTIALPHDWCGYGGVIESFKKKYPDIKVNELNPDAGSADELEAIRANKDNKGPQAPDVIDVGFSFGPAAKKEGLLQPYKVSTWDSIPENVKDPEGYFYGDYYGVLSFVINKDLVKTAPEDWADLLKPEYANSVALAGDPRASNQAILGVYAAGLSAGATGAEAIGQAGLDYFAKMNKAGNFVPTIGKAGTIAQGATPIVIMWDYNGLSARETLKGNPPVDVVVPKTGVVAGVYVQGISAHAPHPNAAKLWMEHLYSDEGQLGWLNGYCHPIRFNSLAAENKIPKDLLDALPPAAAYEKASFPTVEDQDASKAVVTAKWDAVVGANVK